MQNQMDRSRIIPGCNNPEKSLCDNPCPKREPDPAGAGDEEETEQVELANRMA